MVAVIPLAHPLKTWVWVAALIWMACLRLWNARRCGRWHCFRAGPFFRTMTLPVLAHGNGVMSLGPEGWRWLALSIGLGAASIPAITERGGRCS